MSIILNYTACGTRKILGRLNIPLSKCGKLYMFDTSQDSSFAYSIRLQYQNKELKAIYSIRDISKLWNRDKKTVLKSLLQMNVKLYGSPKKKYVMLWDMEQAKKKFWNH